MTQEFVLPQHGNTEECYDEYYFDEDGQKQEVIQESIERKEFAEKYSSAEGLKFTKAMVDNVRAAVAYDEKGRKKTVLKARKTAWIHNLIHLNGAKFDFTGRKYLDPIYNSGDKEILLKTGRQVEKTTLLANNLTVMCALIPYFRCLYVSPSHVQTRTFSNDKLKPVLEKSPLIARYLQDNKVSQQVFEKGFTNGSMCFLRSAFLSADRARGISSDLLCLDELQDLIISNIPVIAQCLSHSKHQYHVYAGTPKTFDNTIENFWDNSAQNEWMVPCSSCSGATGKKWNFLDIGNVGIDGPICKYCGKDIDVKDGQWQKSKESRWKGYRIPQLMVPWIAEKGSESWKTLVHEMETYPDSQFANEVLGLSYDNASKPITRADVLMNCDAKWKFIEPFRVTQEDRHFLNRTVLFAGIDWGEGNDGTGKDVMGKIRNASYTVLTIGGFQAEKFKVFYIKKYKGKEIDPDYIVKDVVKICTALGVKMIGSDWGHGWGVNNQLFRLYNPQRCVQFMYVDNQKEVRKWDPIGYKMQLMRNHAMSEIFIRFKEHNFIFPSITYWEEFAKDIFAISVEYREYERRLKYIHRPSDPDDFFHSLTYCLEAAKIFYGKR